MFKDTIKTLSMKKIDIRAKFHGDQSYGVRM